MTDLQASNAEGELEAFRSQRDRSVRAPQGALSLVATAWVNEPTEIDGVPGTWSPAADGLSVTASATDGIVVDGEPVDGTASVASDDSIAPGAVRFDNDRVATVIGPDAQGRFALRVWDPRSEANANFRGLDAFPFDPDWIKQGTFEAVSDGVEFEYGKSRGGALRRGVSPGRIRFEHEGVEIELLALPANDSLQIVFADATTGNETYDVGRFLFVKPQSGKVELDFNRAVVPPCSMSDQFNCPLPPAGNRLPFAVRAGEKRPRWAHDA